MYVIVARIRAIPETAELYERLIRETADACARYACFVQFNIQRGGADGTEFLLYEIWSDKENYEALRSEPFFRAYLEKREALVEPRIDRTEWALIHGVTTPSNSTKGMPS